MRRYLNFIVSLAALTLIGAINALPAQAQMRSGAAQVYPVLSVNTPLARDEDTFETDKTLKQSAVKPDKRVPSAYALHIF